MLNNFVSAWVLNSKFPRRSLVGERFDVAERLADPLLSPPYSTKQKWRRTGVGRGSPIG